MSAPFTVGQSPFNNYYVTADPRNMNRAMGGKQSRITYLQNQADIHMDNQINQAGAATIAVVAAGAVIYTVYTWYKMNDTEQRYAAGDLDDDARKKAHAVDAAESVGGVTGALLGAGVGFTLGKGIAGPVGAAVGGVVGAVVGTFAGAELAEFSADSVMTSRQETADAS